MPAPPPAEQEASPPPPAPVREASPAPAQEDGDCPFWERMQEILRESGRANLMGFMLDITPALKGDVLLLRSEQDFCLDFLSKPDNKEALAKAAQTAAGGPYQIKFEKMGE